MPSKRKNRRPRPPRLVAEVETPVNPVPEPDGQTETLEQLLEGIGAAAPYQWPVPYRCSAECGQPIRQGHLAVQTSPDLRPLERAHLVCLLNRKGVDSDRAEDGMPVGEVAA